MGTRGRGGRGARASRAPRKAIAVAVVLGALTQAGAMGGCSSTSFDGSPLAIDEDAAIRSDAAGHDATIADAGASGDTGLADAHAAGPHVRLVLVNGSPNAPALRFCFGAGDPSMGGTQLAAVPAEPDDDIASGSNGQPYPGVFAGGGAPAPDPQMDWSQAAVALYAIDAERIRSQVRSQDAAQANCRALLGPGGGGALLTVNHDYWYLGAVPQGTMADGTAWLAAIYGCLPGIADAGPPCDGASDGSAQAMGGLWELDDTTVVAPGAFGAQFANASFALAGAGSNGSGSAGVFVGGDASSPSARILVASNASPGTLRPVSVAPVSGVPFEGGNGFYFEATAADGGIVGVTSPFSSIQQSTWGATVPEGGAFASGAGYVFVLVGDPALPDDGGGPGTRAGRLLAFPTRPPFGSP